LLLLTRPEYAEHVLVDRRENYVKSVTHRPLQAFLGEGLVTSEGEVWERHRRMVQPVFARRHVTGFAADILAATDRLLSSWGTRECLVDGAAQMRSVTLDVVGSSLFGAALGGSAQRIDDALGHVGRAALPLAVLAGAAPRRMSWAWLRRAPGVAGPARTLDGIVGEIVAERRADRSRPETPDLLDLLLAARDEDGSALSDVEVRDEVLTMILAGHETTSGTLTWTLSLLSSRPPVRARLEAEVDEVLGDQPLSAGDVERLPFTGAVIEEALRLYPAAWTLERDAVDEDEIDGFAVPAGSTVVVSPYLLHRHPEFWTRPDDFDPERFMTPSGRPRYAFLPFGAGRRACVGAGFAVFEATLMLAGIIRSHRLDLTDGMPKARAGVNLQPAGPVPMRVHPR
jgi:cytochrome P450